MKKAFTLIEVNLAMLIMAGGILAIVGLYSFGFKENQQSRSDVASAALADAVMGPLIAAASSTDVTWSQFNSSGEYAFPQNGWEGYISGDDFKVTRDPLATASSAYSSFLGKLGMSGSVPSFPSSAFGDSMSCALVITHEEDSAVVTIAFRAVPKNQIETLMSQPLYYTEVRFQGSGELQ